jgi:tRNA dimethylallyltransferase
LSLYALLAEKDPAMAARLKPGDTQRILRALEVIEATGKSLLYFQEQPTQPPLPEAKFRLFMATLPRAEIYRRIDARFLKMMKEGAVEEVRQLVAGGGGHAHLSPLFKAHGVPELMAHLVGEMTLEAAIAKAQQNTRNYAKRQMTWLRNQFPEAVAISAENLLTAIDGSD